MLRSSRTCAQRDLAARIACLKVRVHPILEKSSGCRTAPFYAIRSWPKVHHVSGGVEIDTGALVIDLEGKAIPGLFAAGEVTGGVHGSNRLGSCAITECLVFGRIAGKNAAAVPE